MNKEFICCDCKKTFVADFDSSIPELEAEPCCDDCFMKSLGSVCDDVLAAKEAS